jgi:tetratricopeptide (TPR) repeat protein
MSDSPNPVAEELFNAANALGWIEGVADIERFFLISIRILNASERRGFAYGSTYLASSMSNAVELIGWNSLVNRYASLAKDYARHVEPHRPIFQLDWSQAFHYNINADWEKSIQHARRAAEIAHSTGDMRSWGSGMDLTAWAYHSQGKLAEALEISLEMIEVAEEGSDQQVLCWGLLGLGVIKKRLGQIDEAISDLARAIEVSEEVLDYHTQTAASGWIGRCHVAKGDLDQALTRLETGQQVLSAHGVIIEIAILGNGFSKAYLAAAEGSTGKDREEWLKKAKRSCRDSLKAAKRYRPPLFDAQMFQGRYEWLRGSSSAAEKWWGKALQESKQTNDRYAEGVIHFEIGLHLGDRDHLLRAESILAEIGAEFDLAKTREALANLHQV